MPEPVRACLLTPGESLPAWAATAVERMVDETDAEVTLVVADDSAADDDRSPVEAVRRVVELREWGVVAAAMELLGDDLPHLDDRPLSGIDGLADAERLRCEPEPVDGWKHALPDPVVERVADCDVAVRFGFGFLVGDALTAPEHGVLSFHHGDLRAYRGQPMGFWEFVHGEPEAGITLQRINETLDGGEIVVRRRVPIDDAPTWRAVRARLFGASEDVLAAGVRRVADPGFEPEQPTETELGDLYTLPRGRPVLTYLARTARGTLSG